MELLIKNDFEILTNSFKNYENFIYTILTSKTEKLKKIKDLNIELVNKKQAIKNKIQNLNINFKLIPFYTHKNNLLKSFSLWLSNSNDLNLLKYFEYQKQLTTINHDISHLNTIKKDFMKFFKDFENLNLSYSNKAKITLFDISQAKKGIITHNTKTLFYFYFISLKKNKNIHYNNDLSHDEIINKWI